MSEDKIKPQQRQVTFRELIERLPLSGGVIREQSPFDFSFKGDLTFEVNGPKRTVTITLEVKGRESEEPQPFVTELPFQVFPTPEHIFTFLRDLKRNYFETLRDTLTQEAVLQLQDVTRFLGATMELTPESKEDIAKDHVESTRERVLTHLGSLPDKPKHSRWTKHTLTHAVTAAAAEVGRANGKLTLQTVRDEMAKVHGDDTPASGEALRKQLEEFGVSWTKLKGELRRWLELLKANDKNRSREESEKSAKKAEPEE